MQNDAGEFVDLYVPRKCSASNRIIGAKDHASIQMNISEVDKVTGRVNGQFKTYAICGAIRRMVFYFNGKWLERMQTQYSVDEMGIVKGDWLAEVQTSPGMSLNVHTASVKQWKQLQACSKYHHIDSLLGFMKIWRLARSVSNSVYCHSIGTEQNQGQTVASFSQPGEREMNLRGSCVVVSRLFQQHGVYARTQECLCGDTKQQIVCQVAT
ncbi:hypothetical protein KIL84_009936 [Mauremys mutica]|uniref:Small ribosomal subunit protein eS21 n=1 Tax=Mauremys mutica TaxID=74926 RepID=A0A9D3XLK3_9SAUR|nr:hypothetical protein KIL84_009936 [Mauremys mutica]